VLTWVLDEFGHQREDESIVGYQFRFQDRMVIGGVSMVCHGQTMRTVAFREGERAGAINDDQEVAAAQAIGVEHFLADQSFHRPAHDVLHFCDVQTLVSLVDGVSVGTGLDVEHSLKLGR